MFPVRGVGSLEPQTAMLFERSTFISAYILFAESWAPQFVVSCFLERNGCNAVLVPEIGYTGCTRQRFHIHESVCSLINDANLPVQPPGVFK